MKKFSWWLIGIGGVLFLVATVGGHFLQYVIGYENACVVAGITGVVAGSIAVQGLIIRIGCGKTPGGCDETAGGTP